jgi:hypothetical protein
MDKAIIQVGSKIKPVYNSLYMEIVDIFEYDGVKYIAYIWHNEDKSIVKSTLYERIDSHVDTLEHFSQIVNEGRHENI